MLNIQCHDQQCKNHKSMWSLCKHELCSMEITTIMTVFNSYLWSAIILVVTNIYLHGYNICKLQAKLIML